tara:strand:+ start:184 stop:693 length:510 start_codon:yes stop_codon:yes gene_type:complete
MSKSTPISQLNKNVNSSEEEKESLLVNEILNEINKDEGQPGENLNMEILTQELEEPPQEIPQAAEVPPVPEQEMVNPIAPQEPTMEEPNMMFEAQPEQERSMVQDLMDNLKAPLIVGALVVLFSVPQITEILSNLVPPREILQKFKLPVVLLMKFVLSAVVFFALNMVM